MHGGERAVVEERDRTVRLFARVVLPRRGGPRPQLEARVPAAQFPAHLTGLRIDVVRRPGVPRAHEQIAVLLGVDRVDVKVVVRFPPARVHGRGVGIRQGHMIEAVPLVHHEAGLQVDLLQQRVRDGAVGGTADLFEIAVDRVVDRDQPDPPRCDLEFVQVGLVAVAGAHDGDGLIGAVHDHLARRPASIRYQRILPPGEHGFAFVLLHAKGRGARAGGRECPEPDEVSMFVEDHRPVLTDPGVGGEEQVTGRRLRLGGHGHIRRAQFRARVKALYLARVGRDALRGDIRQGIRLGDNELKGEWLGLAGGGPQLSVHAHRLARAERLG